MSAPVVWWACCVSPIGPVCQHLTGLGYRPCAACNRPIRKVGGRYETADGKSH